MGLETTCKTRLNGIDSVGKAHCGDNLLEFSGDFKIKWKWSELSSIEAHDGVLTARRKEDSVEMCLGDAAAKWVQAILNPKSRLDKLGLKPNHSYQVWGEMDDEFLVETVDRAGPPSTTPSDLDVVFIRMNSPTDLPLCEEAREKIIKNGMIWIVWPKGRKEFGESHVRAFADTHGLVDVKVASFSSTLSALKLVIPVKDR